MLWGKIGSGANSRFSRVLRDGGKHGEYMGEMKNA